MSDISFLAGTIGSGKSFTAARYRCLELRRTERMIVTNLSGWYGNETTIPKGKMSLAEWCHDYVDRAIDVQSRVYILQDREVLEFFRYYPSGDSRKPLVMPLRWDGEGKNRVELPDLKWRQDQQISGAMRPGCLFILDEAHLHFDARHWQKVSVAVSHYMSQLRKLNDDIILVSQNAEKIDKNFRRDATEVIYVKNCGKAKYLMGVKFPGQIKLFKFRFFPARTDKPESSTVIKLRDERYEDTYDTMAGVGLTGAMEPEHVEKGGHWWRWVAVGAVALFAIVMGPRLMMNMIGRTVGGFMGQFHAGVEKKMHGGGVIPGVASIAAPSPGAVGSERVRVAPVKSNWTMAGPEESSEVYWSGLVIEGSDVRVMLSDGTTYRRNDGHLQFVKDKVCMIDGVRYSWLSPVERAKREKQQRLAAPAVRRSAIEASIP